MPTAGRTQGSVSPLRGAPAVCRYLEKQEDLKVMYTIGQSVAKNSSHTVNSPLSALRIVSRAHVMRDWTSGAEKCPLPTKETKSRSPVLRAAMCHIRALVTCIYFG